MDAAPVAKLPGHVSCISRPILAWRDAEHVIALLDVGGVIEHMYFTADSRPSENYFRFQKPGCSGDTRSAESAESIRGKNSYRSPLTGDSSNKQIICAGTNKKNILQTIRTVRENGCYDEAPKAGLQETAGSSIDHV